MKEKINIFWFRRDLRIQDNIGFYNTLQGKFKVLPIFIFDTQILDELPEVDARVNFIYQSLEKINNVLQQYDAKLSTFLGTPEAVFGEIGSVYNIQNVITNREPYALNRDHKISTILSEKNSGFYTFKDQVIFEKNEITKQDGSPYVVYTPYMKLWKSTFTKLPKIQLKNAIPFFDKLLTSTIFPFLTLEEVGFKESNIQVIPYKLTGQLIDNYEAKRNFPSKNGTSCLGPHLRFGTVSIREIVIVAIAQENEIFLQELIWREFFMQILWHFPETVTKAFKSKYDYIPWRNKDEEFDKWKTGNTGYPFVDAGMRELNATGYMHNRARMLVASFLCKHLLIDWRWGEAYFAQKLLDYEQASNIGNWQWAAGSGVDAAPYFRIFNPITQLDKFDKNHNYIKKWVPEYQTATYPKPIVEHKMARERALKTYKNALNS